MRPVEKVLERLEAVKAVGPDRWQAACPAHPDRNPSLSVGVGDDEKALVHCFTGCNEQEIVAAIGLSLADLFPAKPKPIKEIVATYPYCDESGELLFEVVRYQPKDFRQRRPDGNGGYSWKLADTRRVLYRLPKVIAAAKAGEKIVVVEGEKDVAALEAKGIVATSCPAGAGKWRPEYSESLRGAKVAVIADKDEPGRKHAEQVAASLKGIAAEVKILEPAVGKDISDHLGAGRPLADLVDVTPDAEEATDRPQKPDSGRERRLRVLDVAAMVANQPPAVPWVIDGLAVKGTLTLLSGKEGEGKSLVSMALSTGVALGENIAGFTCKQQKVLIVDAENGEYEIHRRVKSLGLPSSGVTVVEADGFHLGHDLGELEALLEREQPGLVILDSFRSLWPGGDENDSGAVAGVLDPLRNLLRRLGPAGLLLHHVSRAGNDYRGTSAIGAAIELGFRLSRHPSDPEARDRRYLHCFKCRPAPEPEDRWLRLHIERGQVFIDKTDSFVSEEDEEKQLAPARAELAPDLLAAAATPTSWPDLARAIDRSPKDGTARRLRDDLLKNGELVRLPGGNFRVPTTSRVPTKVAPLDSAAESQIEAGCHGATPPRGGAQVAPLASADPEAVATPEEEAERERLEPLLEGAS